jgi:predicted Rossmann fold flavoprotein
MNHAEVLVIGGGAAGLMCAITAARGERHVLVLEGSNRVGKKILMSGGGRCNFTNLYCEPGNFISRNPHFCKSALSRYTQHDFIALVDKHEIPWHEKTPGQLFCDNSSKDIVAMLLQESEDAGVSIETDCAIEGIAKNDRFVAHTNKGICSGDALVIATGGLSIPKMGASGFGYDVARQFGHEVLETRAGLVPFTLTGAMHEMSARLTGVSTRVTVTVNDISFTEDLLFTHRGLSGPAILQASSYWQPGDEIEVDLLPGEDAVSLLLEARATQPRSLLRTVLGARLPRKLISELQAIMWSAQAEKPVGEIGNNAIAAVGGTLNAWHIKPAATEGYRTAEGTLGGVATEELSSKTMESRLQSGLYFVGEVVDVTGHLGGFNFQWAWSSGHAAGAALSK